MSPLPSAAAEPPAAAENPSWWRYLWEAQSHTSVLRLLLFSPNTKPSAECTDLKLNLLHQQSLLTVSFLESEAQIETSIKVPVPRVLIDPDALLHFRTFEDHIEVKLVLLLPVDHPLVSDFDSILSLEENKDELRPLSVDSDLKNLSRMKEVHFYCRNCSFKLTKGLRCFEEMPSNNWREAADNWFGNCCCSFGGVSEKLVAKYAKSYTCDPGVCLLNTASVLLCTNDFLGCEFPDVKERRNFEPDGPDLNSTTDNCLNRVSQDEICSEVRPVCCGNHTEDKIMANKEYETVKHVNDDEDNCLSHTFSELQIEDNKGLTKEKLQNCDTEFCTPDVFLENQKVFLDGYLGNGFMVRSSGLSKYIQWNKFLCPECSCLLGVYPCFEDNVPLDGGVRLFKCYISTCLPSTGSDDVFRGYILERMFASELLESAEDELSFRTIVRDMETKSPVLQIILLNPNTWSCAGCLQPTEPTGKLVMHPSVKVLFSASSHGTEFDSRTLEDWVRKNQADEIYMFSSQILELTRVLDQANTLSPPSCTSLQGLLLSSMRR